VLRGLGAMQAEVQQWLQVKLSAGVLGYSGDRPKYYLIMVVTDL